MLLVKHISVTQFKNYEQRSFELRERIIGITGKNGAGKTTLLDAIYYLCFTRSYFTRQDTFNVKHGRKGFRIEGELELQDIMEKAVCILRETGKKEFLVNDQPYEKFSQHIGHYPCVIIAPDDAQLLTGGSEERRKFIDSLLSQLDNNYLQQLIRYNKLVIHRNSLLRSFAESRAMDENLLSVLDEQLSEPCNYIFTTRKEFLVSFLPMVKHLYYEIAGEAALDEQVNIFYESDLLLTGWKELLAASRQKDLLSQRTNAGIHRDDLDIQLNDFSFKNLASQGQRKSLLFAMKLAELEVLEKEKHFAPILLLDDVFEKLDNERMANLIERVCLQNEGQVFITDTNRERLVHYLGELGIGYQLLEI